MGERGVQQRSNIPQRGHLTDRILTSGAGVTHVTTTICFTIRISNQTFGNRSLRIHVAIGASAMTIAIRCRALLTAILALTVHTFLQNGGTVPIATTMGAFLNDRQSTRCHRVGGGRDAQRVSIAEGPDISRLTCTTRSRGVQTLTTIQRRTVRRQAA